MEIEEFTANLPTIKKKLVNKQSPRGLREEDKRVITFDVKIDKNYNLVELCKLVRYLNELTFAMEIDK